MKLEVNISKKAAIFIFAAILVLATTIGVIAYNSVPTNPAVMGHTFNELANPTVTFINAGSWQGPYKFCTLSYVVASTLDDTIDGNGNQDSSGCSLQYDIPSGNWYVGGVGESAGSCAAVCFN